ncbi:MAG: hypothetical protein EBQ73_09620 [Gammaproteobacteria bacterium]|nr:hypothetical protein [Gammaproteobacteria bacterium]
MAMAHQRITLSRQLTNQLLALAQAAGPEGLSGIISGDQGQLQSFHAVNPALVAAEKALQDRLALSGEKITATVHSYHEGLPTLQRDLPPMSLKPDLPHLIVTTNIKGVLEMRAFELFSDDAPREIPLSLREERVKPS